MGWKDGLMEEWGNSRSYEGKGKEVRRIEVSV